MPEVAEEDLASGLKMTPCRSGRWTVEIWSWWSACRKCRGKEEVDRFGRRIVEECHFHFRFVLVLLMMDALQWLGLGAATTRDIPLVFLVHPATQHSAQHLDDT